MRKRRSPVNENGSGLGGRPAAVRSAPSRAGGSPAPASVSPARRIAYQVLRRADAGPDLAADLLRAPEVSELPEADRNLATELVLGTLRRRAELDLWITRLSGKPLEYFDSEVALALRLGIYQIRLLHRIPNSAAVNEAVEMVKAARKRSAAGLVNAVLRKCPPMDPACQGIDADSLRLALPSWLGDRWARQFGREAVGELARWSLESPRVTVRITEPGCQAEEIQQELAREGIAARPSSLLNSGGGGESPALRIERGSITRSKLWQSGALVIQDEASQLVGSLLRPEPGQRVLDLCAAPGMKTAQIAAGLGHGLLVACDRSARRLRHLADLPPGLAVRRHLVRLDASQPLPFATAFDRILLDAPCSGTGTLARNPEIKWRLQPADLERLAEMQTRMLAGALEALAAGGRLLYATCSLETEENESVVEKVLAQKRGFRRLVPAEVIADRPALAPLFDQDGYFRTRPDLHEMDGFFAALIGREA